MREAVGRPSLVNRDRFHSSLLVLQAVSLATLVRSVAFDRWITVFVATMLFVGALAAKRDRAWGVALALVSAAWFPVAWMIGIAPSWFAFVGAAGMMPFLIASRAFVKFDRGATALLASIAGVLGIAGAVGWKAAAIPLIHAVPALRPGIYPQHGALLGAIVAVAAVAMHLTRRTPVAVTAEGARLRVAEPARVRVAVEEELAFEEESPEIGTTASRDRNAAASK